LDVAMVVWIAGTGDLLSSLQEVPFVGGRVGDVAERVKEAGRNARVSGRASRDSTENLSALLALAIGLIPTLPLLGLYAPLRIAWTREARAVRRSLATAPSDRVLKEYLARRAVASLSFQELLAVTKDPFGDLDEGRFDALAERELDRLGLRRRHRLSA
jgi:hypothetical protein